MTIYINGQPRDIDELTDWELTHCIESTAVDTELGDDIPARYCDRVWLNTYAELHQSRYGAVLTVH